VAFPNLHHLSELPIGIFDSGVGGLTVLDALRARLPGEGFIYLGDTARVPYGTKSRATVERYALEDARFLVRRGIKMLVVACNTASAVARERLHREFDLPLLSVIGPGARAAARSTRSGRIGVIATEATIESGAYTAAIREASTARAFEITARACPLFVPLAEEGECDSQIARLVAAQYLAPLRAAGVDTLVLGCTHYPLLKRVIAAEMGPEVELVDSAAATAEEAAARLASEGLLRRESAEPAISQFFVTDAAARFHRLAARILGGPLPHLEAVEVWGHDQLS
jgi:glutamate racemase